MAGKIGEDARKYSDAILLVGSKDMFYKEAINAILQQILYTNNDFVKVYNRGGLIEACNDFF